MKNIIVMRHAKSSWSDAHLADHERPLNKRGRRDAPLMGKMLYQEDLTPQFIICSTAKRARATAEAAAESSNFDGQITFVRELYHAGAQQILEHVSAVDDTFHRIMIVGHNPGMEDLVEELTGKWERMPTAAVANIELSINRWLDAVDSPENRLIDLWIPRQVAG